MIINVKNFKKEIKWDIKKSSKKEDIKIALNKRMYGLYMHWLGLINGLKNKMFSNEEVEELKEFMISELKNTVMPISHITNIITKQIIPESLFKYL